MNVKLIGITKPSIDGVKTPEEFIQSKKIFFYKDNILINSFSTTIEAANIYKKARSTISRYIENGIDIEGNRWEK